MAVSEIFWLIIEQLARFGGPLFQNFVGAAKFWDYADWVRNAQELGRQWGTLKYVVYQLQQLLPELELLPDILMILKTVIQFEIGMLAINILQMILPFW